jgi:hypothetical protein
MSDTQSNTEATLSKSIYERIGGEPAVNANEKNDISQESFIS